MSLLRSTAIIVFGNVGSRVLSFISKILLARVLTATELGGWQLLQTWYFSLSGPFIGVIQTVVTQIVAFRGARAKQKQFLIASCIYCLIGFALVLLPMLLLPEMYRPEGSEYFYQVWQLMLPSYLVTVFAQVLKGWLMGRQIMGPVVLNQWIEQAFELAGMAFIWYYDLNGFVPLILTFLIADIAALIHLLGCWIYYRDGKEESSNFQVWRELFHHGLPHSVSRGVGSLGRIGEASLIPMLLIASGLSSDEALGLFGQYGALAMPTLSMPSLLIVSLATAILPEAAQEKNLERQQHLIRRSVSVALILGLPIGIFFTLEGAWLGELLFANPAVGEMIAMLAPMSLLVYVDIVTSQLLRAVGRSIWATLMDIITFAVKLLLLFAAVVSGGGFVALTEATIISSFVGALGNLFLLLKETNLGFDLKQWLLRPLLVTVPFTVILLLPFAGANTWVHLGQIGVAFGFLALAVIRIENEK